MGVDKGAVAPSPSSPRLTPTHTALRYKGPSGAEEDISHDKA